MLVSMNRELSRPNTTIETHHSPDTPIDQEVSDDILTLPNLVTTIGGLCSIYGIRNAGTVKGIAALVIGELSDKADGTLARRLHQQSKLGIKLDPIRDKVVAATALLKIVEDGLASKTIVASMTSLEATKAIATLIAEHKHRQLPTKPNHSDQHRLAASVAPSCRPRHHYTYSAAQQGRLATRKQQRYSMALVTEYLKYIYQLPA